MADNVRQNMALTADIQECRRQVEFWTNKLNRLEEQHRRASLFRRLQNDHKTTWDALSEEERTKDVVLAILEKDPHFFGECPWKLQELDREYLEGHAVLPGKFSRDRDVVLTYARGEHYKDDSSMEEYWYHIPDFLSDDEEVVKVICSKHWRSLQDSSPRLRDSKDVVLAAIVSDEWCSCNAIRYASDRLKGDMDILLATVDNVEYDFSLIGKQARFPNFQVARDVAMAMAKRLGTIDDDGFYDDDVNPLPHLPDYIRDDKQIMLEFAKLCGYNLEWSSERLQADEELVKAAVKMDPPSVDYSRGIIRRELMSDASFMMSVIRSYGGGKMLTSAPSEMQNDRNAVMEAVTNGLKHRNVPHRYRSDPEIALRCIHKIGGEELSDLDESVQITQSFALAAVDIDANVFGQLPEELQEDEKVALQTLKGLESPLFSLDTLRRVMEKNPTLLQSREVVMRMVGNSNSMNLVPEDILVHCPFVDDKEFILEAFQKDYFCVLEYMSARLCADRDVVLGALSHYHRRRLKNDTNVSFPLTRVPAEFLLSNIDIVVKAIEVLHVNDIGLFRDKMPLGVWSEQSVVFAWLSRGWAFFGLIDMQSSFRGDPELVTMAVRNDWSEFKYADPALQADREFVLSLVKTEGRVLAFAQDELKRDLEILTIATANTEMTVATAFSDIDDFDFLVSYATGVRDKVDLYENVFVRELLRGIASTDQSFVAPANRCRLPMLDQGVETTTVFKRTIAQFLGVPLGEELHLLRRASSSLAKCGY